MNCPECNKDLGEVSEERMKTIWQRYWNLPKNRNALSKLVAKNKKNAPYTGSKPKWWKEYLQKLEALEQEENAEK